MIRTAFEGMHPWVRVIFFGSMVLTGIAVAAFVGVAAVSVAHGWSIEHTMVVAGQPETAHGFWTNIVVNCANQLIAFGAAGLAFGWLFQRDRLDGLALRWSRGSLLQWTVLAGVGMVCALPFIDLSHRLNTWLIQFLPDVLRDQADYFERLATQTTEALLISPAPFAGLALMVAIAVLPGVCEEIAFRSVLQPLLVRSSKRMHLGIWLGAAVFSAIHMQFHGFLPRMVIGAGLGYIVVWSGSIWPAMVAHFINNGSTVWQARMNGAEWVQAELNATTNWELGDYIWAAGMAFVLALVFRGMNKLAPWPEQAERYRRAVLQS